MVVDQRGGLTQAQQQCVEPREAFGIDMKDDGFGELDKGAGNSEWSRVGQGSRCGEQIVPLAGNPPDNGIGGRAGAGQRPGGVSPRLEIVGRRED